MKIEVDLEYLRKQKIHFCVPAYGGMITESTFMSFIKWSNAASQLKLEWTLETMTNESLISRGRNTLAAKFLASKDSTHLFFVDADIGWEPWHLMSLIMRKKELVGGLYPMKTLPLKWVVNGVNGGEEDGDLVEVSKTGTGFMLIERSVFETVKQHSAVQQYNSDIGLDPKYNKFMYSFFDSTVRDGRFYSEDWDFCEKYRDMGGKVFVDKRVLLKHTGTYTFSLENQQILKDSFSKSE